MSEVDLRAGRGTRVGVFVAVAALHLIAVALLIRAFAPDFTAQAVESVVSTFSVTVTTPPPEPEPTKQPEPAGAAGDEGKKAIPREVIAPKPKVVVTKKANPAPRATSTGKADTSGAGDSGSGTGAGGTGSGTGSGAGGNGTGGGQISKPVKIAGEINSARDYPRETRELRINDYVIVYLTVGTDGRAKNCRVHRPSRDAEANAITCRLAQQRFRFKPATDSAGNPVEATYGWQQRWFY